MTGQIPTGSTVHGDGVAAALLLVLELQRQAWGMPTAGERRYHMVNHTRRLAYYRQGAFVSLNAGGRPRVEAVSNIAVLDPNAPFVRWLEAVGRSVAGGPRGADIHVIDSATLPESVRRDWQEWGPAQALWCPLARAGGVPSAGLWLARDDPWTPTEILLLSHLAEGYGCVWDTMTGERRGPAWRRLGWPLAAALAVAAVLAVPVPMSTLAPAEIQAADPVIVAAPLDGVIERFHVHPNQPVKAGQPLFSFDATVLRSRHAVASKALAQAEAELLTATQVAFADPQTKARVAQLRAQVDLRRAELVLAGDLLDRVTVKAEQDGTALFTDANDWIGRPVTVGERVMTIADPGTPEIDAYVPVGDALTLAEGAPVELFLNSDPLHPVRARLIHASYDAGLSAAGILSYRVRAALEPGGATPRIGLRGIAKIWGERVPLALFLLRRPLAAVRQFAGF